MGCTPRSRTQVREDLGVQVSLHSSSSLRSCSSLPGQQRVAAQGFAGSGEDGGRGRGSLGNPKLPPPNCPEPGPGNQESIAPLSQPQRDSCPVPPWVPHVIQMLIPSARTPILVSRKGCPSAFSPDWTSSGSPVHSPLCPVTQPLGWAWDPSQKYSWLPQAGFGLPLPQRDREAPPAPPPSQTVLFLEGIVKDPGLLPAQPQHGCRNSGKRAAQGHAALRLAPCTCCLIPGPAVG